MDLSDISMTQSYGFKESSYSFRNSDKSNSPNKKTRYKCYECGGDAFKSSRCGTCQGLKQVTQNDVMVSLLYQIMYCKLGKDVPLRNFPILEFTAQNRNNQKNYRINEQVAIKTKDRGSIKNKVIQQNNKKQHYSQGNSMQDSNSLNSSMDSLDSSKNTRQSIKSKQKLQKNKSKSNLYHHPHFKQQISEIKEQSCAAEQHTVICDSCHREGQLGTDYMECRTCQHFYICMKCYEEKVQQFGKIHNNILDQIHEDTAHDAVQRKSSLKLAKSGTQQQNRNNPQVLKKAVQKKVSSPKNAAKQPGSIKLQSKNKSCQYDKNEVIFDNYRKIHEHPLTRYCYRSEEEEEEKQNKQQMNTQFRVDQQQIYSTYGDIAKKQIKQSRKQQYSMNFRNIFKTHENQPQCKIGLLYTSGNALTIPNTNIEIINEQKQSPSPSQKSLQNSPDNQRILMKNKGSDKDESQFDRNISMTVSNNFQSPESQKNIQELKNKNSSQFNKSENNCISENSNPSPVETNHNYDFRVVNQFKQSGALEDQERCRKIQLFWQKQQQDYNKNQLIAHTNINRDLSQWSQYSKLNVSVPNSSSSNRQKTKQEMEQKEIMPNEEQTQSLIIQTITDEKSIQSSKQTHEKADDQFDQSKIREVKQKSYTQKKPNKFVSIRFNLETQQNDKQTNNMVDVKQQIDSQKIVGNNVAQGQSKNLSVPIPTNLFNGKLAQSQQWKNNNILGQLQLDSQQHQQKAAKSNDYDILDLCQQKEINEGGLNQKKQSAKQQNVANLTPQSVKQSKIFSRTMSFETDIKLCSHCIQEISNRALYMKCQTCRKYGKPPYQLCDKCCYNKEIIAKHNAAFSDINTRHSFQPFLHRKSKSSAFLEQETDWRNQGSVALSNEDNTAIDEKNATEYTVADTNNTMNNTLINSKQEQKQNLKSAQSQFQQNACRTVEDGTYKINIVKQENCHHSLKIDPEDSMYALKRKKQVENNKKCLKFFQKILSKNNRNKASPQTSQKEAVNDRWLSIQNSDMSYKDSGLEDKNEGKLSVDRYSSNVGVDGMWLIDQNQKGLHDSCYSIPKISTNSQQIQQKQQQQKIQQGYVNNKNKNEKQNKTSLENTGMEQNRQQTVGNAQNIINIISTSKTIHSCSSDQNNPNQNQIAIVVNSVEDKQKQHGNVSSSNLHEKCQKIEEKYPNKEMQMQKQKKLATSLTIPQPIRTQPAPDRQSPSRKSRQSGSPDRSQFSSRIQVDCGESDSQDYYNHQASPPHTKNTPSQMLVKSHNIGEEQGILNKSYVQSQIFDSNPRLQQNVLQTKGSYQKNKTIQQRSLKDAFYIPNKEGSLNSYHIKTHKCNKQEEDSPYFPNQQSFPNEKEFTEDDLMKTQVIRKKSRRSEDSRSVSRSEEHTSKSSRLSKKSNKSQQKQQEGEKKNQLIIDFLNKLDKSQRYSHSQGSEVANSSGKKQNKIHFDYENKEGSPANESNSNQKRQIDRQEDPYTFQGYRCDNCAQVPIRARYHCQTCEDFDLCCDCFAIINQIHTKSHKFIKITKQEQEKIQQQQKQKQQSIYKNRNEIIFQILKTFIPKDPKTADQRMSLPNSTEKEGTGSKMGSSSFASLSRSFFPKQKGQTMGRSSNI